MDPINELPLGFGMALAKNEKALLRFGEMDEAQKRQILKRTHDVSSKGEMQALVDSIVQ